MSTVGSASVSASDKIATPPPSLTQGAISLVVNVIQTAGAQNQERELKSLTYGNHLVPVSAGNSSLNHNSIEDGNVIQPPLNWVSGPIAAQLWQKPGMSVSEETIQKVNYVHSFLEEKGYELKGVPADGDCFCHAFLGSYDLLRAVQKIPLLETPQDKIAFLRAHISAQFERTPKGSKNVDRVDQLLKKGIWIDSSEGGLLAIALRIPIRVITINYDAKERRCGINDMLTFAEPNKPSQDWDMIPDNTKPENYIFIIDLGGHFVYASKPESRFTQSIPAETKNRINQASKIVLPSPPPIETQPGKKIKYKKQPTEKTSFSSQNLSPLPLSWNLGLYPVLDPTAKKPNNDQFIRSIKNIIESDPHFSKPVDTGWNLLGEIHEFLSLGGKPTVVLPEIRIGTVCLRNITCFELLYRIYHLDIEGLTVFWDNIEIGPEINQAFKLEISECLCVIDTLIEEPLLSIEEFVALIQCIQASDPFLYEDKDTANRALHLMEKFLKSHGDPLLYISNVRMGDERLEKLTIYEWVYRLWKIPPEATLDDWDFVDRSIEELEDEDIPEDSVRTPPPTPQLFNDRFRDIHDRCFLLIQQKLDRNEVKDEDFLSLIRCVVQFSEECQSDNISSERTGRNFLHIMHYFVQRRVNPNLLFPHIEINGNVYSQATCLHLTYLLWRTPNTLWSDAQEELFGRCVNAMLSDPRTDLTLKFSERSLTAHHFVNRMNIDFYRKQHGTKEKFYTNGNYEPDETVIDQLHGHSLERMTIAHYAVIANDFPMLSRFLDLEPRLLNMTCCMTRGKATASGRGFTIRSQGKGIEVEDLETNEQLSGVLPIKPKHPEYFPMHIQMIRATNVTLLHLAARVGKAEILACLGSRHPNPAMIDSDNKTPQDYLKFSIIEGLVPKDHSTRMMFQSLDLVTQYHSTRALPEVHKLFHFDGYDLLVDTSRRVAIFARQRLTKGSFGNASRKGHKWVEDHTLPVINRPSDNDYKKSGCDRGHLAPAEDASGSNEKMAATHHLVNAVPQNININRGAWRRLEEHVRNLTLQNDLVEVFTGPLFVPQNNVAQNRVIGQREVHVPTHLFKIIYKHNRETTTEIYIFPNQTNTKKEHFSSFRNDNLLDFIQHHSGILFSQWIRK